MPTETKPAPLHLHKLEIRNYKRLRAVTITPDGAMVEIKGRNAQGKSSVLDAVHVLLGGKGAMAADPIRHGATEAEIDGDLGEYRVRRRIGENGKGELTVTRADGVPITGPQTFLDSLVSRGLAFDPTLFVTLEPKAQVEQLRKLTGLDFKDLEDKIAKARAERTIVNRQLDTAKVKLRSLPAPRAGLPATPLVVGDLVAERDQKQKIIADNGVKRCELREVRERITDIEKEVSELEDHLLDARQRLESNRKRFASVYNAVAGLSDPDLASVDKQIRDCETINAEIRGRDAYDLAEREAAEFKGKADALTADIDTSEAAKLARLEATPMPVEGLSFDDSGVTYKGVPFEQASGAEKLRVSVAIALADHPRLKLCLIRNGNVLDTEGRAIVAELAAKAGAQVFMEVVTDGDDDEGIVIEDGTVKALQETTAGV